MRAKEGNGMRWVLGLLAALVAGWAWGEGGVVVDAATRVVLGEQDQISAKLFGITAFEGFPAAVGDPDYRARVAALRPGCFRFGGAISWFCPDHYDPAWYDSADAARQFEETLLYGARYAFGHFAPVVRELGAETIFSFGNPPAYLAYEDSSRPADFDKWAETCAGFVGLWRRFDPGLKRVQIWNEPNADWFRDKRLTKEVTAAGLHIEMANKVARAIKARFPDILVGGPVLCWPPAWPPTQTGMAPWYTWQEWTLPWLAGTKDTVDFYDFHVYNVSPDDFAVQTEMLANQAVLTQGRKLPVWITESNYELPAAELDDGQAQWTKRVLPYERLLLRGMLPQADKVEGNLVHDLHARSFAVLRDVDAPEPMYWLLWILRDLRGQRIVADSGDPQVVSFATAEQDRVTMVLFNDSDGAKQVPLSVSMPVGWWTGPEVRAIGRGAGGGVARLALNPQFQRNGGVASATVDLPPFATISVSFRMDHFSRPGATRTVSEHFGDRTLQFIRSTEPVSVSIRAPKVGEGKAWVRVGLLGPEGDEQVAARLNGKEVALRATALQDILLAPGMVQEDNRLEVWLRQAVENPKLALGFASVVTEEVK